MTQLAARSFSQAQYDLMEVIRRGNPDGTMLDMDQLLDVAPVKKSKQAMQFSLRFLIKAGVVAKAGTEHRHKRRRVIFTLTPLAYLYLDSDPDVVVRELLKDAGL